MPLLILLTIVLLVFIGLAIFQIAVVTPRENPSRKTAMLIGVVALSVSVLIALVMVTRFMSAFGDTRF